MRDPTFEPNDRISVRSTAQEDMPFFSTKVEGVSDDGYWIYAPLTDNYKSILNVGDSIELVCSRGSALYYFGSQITGRRRDRVLLLSISEPHFIMRVQRREHVRVPVYMGLNYAFCDEGAVDLKWREAATIDMSGGGICLFIGDGYREMKVGRTIMVALPIRHHGDTLDVRARIVRVDDAGSLTERTGIPGVCIGARFESITDGEQREIVGYVFNRQRELIQKAGRPE